MGKKVKDKSVKNIESQKPQDQWSLYQGDTELGQVSLNKNLENKSNLRKWHLCDSDYHHHAVYTLFR
jgi:hypothetical protein